MNNHLAENLVQQLLLKGVREFCLAPGARNAPLVYALMQTPGLKGYIWPEERSAAFFALGKIKATNRPVAVITTSGTAAAELLPAAIEAYYTSLPLLLITADRPRRYRGSGAPQSIEQVGLFSYYVHYMQDIEAQETCCLAKWQGRGPAHLNVCLEEPKDRDCRQISIKSADPAADFRAPSFGSRHNEHELERFLEEVRFPFVVVGALPSSDKEAVVAFLLQLQAPVYLEAHSGLREDSRLVPFAITAIDGVWDRAAKWGYPIDGLLRIGGIPTGRLWRDLEDREISLKVCSISDHPFSGLSWGDVIHAPLSSFFNQVWPKRSFPCEKWVEADRAYEQRLLQLFAEEPLAEASLFHQLSKQIAPGSKVYVGNSLPIREWDLAATREVRRYQLAASRGANGIDGQLATFLGFSSPEQDNWAILGDLTALYDMVAPWITAQLPPMQMNVVIVNNGGAQIFARMFAHEAFRNQHHLSFKPLADFWQWQYERWEEVPSAISSIEGGRFIELVPDLEATKRFLQKQSLL